METAIKELFRKNNGILKTSEIQAAGCYYGKIQRLVDSGEIEPIRRGYYRYVDNDIYSDIPIIASLFPDAVLCLESALDFYGYIDRTPDCWHVAVKNTSARARFNTGCIRIKPHFITPEKFSTGITTENIDGFDIKIYDRDKTICDILSYKNKLDAEIYSQAVKGYINDNKKDVASLAKYAKKLHVESKLREVLLAWL